MPVHHLHRDTYVEPDAPRFESFDGNSFHNPIAAHAASEVEDPRPIPGAGPVVWLVGGVAAIAVIALALNLVARAGWL